jgi:hypothetical protein
MVLNTTAAAATGATRWNSTTPTDTVFSLGTDTSVNASGGTYVAYIYAHNAGGFGLTGTDNVISCGSFTTDGSGNATVTLGYEPQWVMIKQTDDTGSWFMLDTMRGWSMSNDARLFANLSNSETTSAQGNPTSTGFSAAGFSFSGTFIYIAIRRGPMRVPTTGTSVLGINRRQGTDAAVTVTGGAGVTDLSITKNLDSTSVDWIFLSRLMLNIYLASNAVNGDRTSASGIATNPWDVMDGVKFIGAQNINNNANFPYINYLLDRAPGFMDVVCYTGTGSNTTQNHNLAAVPELIIVKGRSASNTAWQVYSSVMANTEYLVLNTTAAKATGATRWNSTTPTSTVFSLGTASEVNTSAANYVAYLFASCPGVSKVGSYTGTGATQVINCGFTAGARFIFVKATSTTGDWLIWDTVRGIIAGNDPYLRLNTTDASVTNTDWVDTAATGFELSNAVGNLANTNGVTYIFLAIA